MRRTAILLVLGTALATTGCGKKAETPAPDTPAAAAPAAPEPTPAAATNALAAAPAAFGQCAACHSIQAGKHGIGPSLVGVYGTKAGDIAGYSFSPALKASGLTWDDATLDKWLAGPMKLVPGTKMTYAGLSDAAKRAELIAWLKTLK